MDIYSTGINVKYFHWLVKQVCFIDSDECYVLLLNHLHSTNFYAILPNDENRARDGLDIREAFYSEHSEQVPNEDCSFLEFLFALSKKMNYICAAFDEDKTKEIFWRLLLNIDLASMSDRNYGEKGGDIFIDEVLNRVMDRKYEVNGYGGLFPMRKPRQNQREVEIWYQMNQYLSDPNGIGLKSF